MIYSSFFLFWRLLQILDYILWQRRFNLSLPIINSIFHHFLSWIQALRRFCSSWLSREFFLVRCIESRFLFIFFSDLFVLLIADFIHRNILMLYIWLILCLIPHPSYFIFNNHSLVQTLPNDWFVSRQCDDLLFRKLSIFYYIVVESHVFEVGGLSVGDNSSALLFGHPGTLISVFHNLINQLLHQIDFLS